MKRRDLLRLVGLGAILVPTLDITRPTTKTIEVQQQPSPTYPTGFNEARFYPNAYYVLRASSSTSSLSSEDLPAFLVYK